MISPTLRAHVTACIRGGRPVPWKLAEALLEAIDVSETRERQHATLKPHPAIRPVQIEDAEMIVL